MIHPDRYKNHFELFADKDPIGSRMSIWIAAVFYRVCQSKNIKIKLSSLVKSMNIKESQIQTVINFRQIHSIMTWKIVSNH